MVRLLARALGLAALVAAAALPACKAGKGDACRCASDCRSGLQCAAEGAKPRKIDGCGVPGDTECCYANDPDLHAVCVESVDAQAGFDTEVDPGQDMYPMNKRDFGVPTSSDGESGSSTSGATTSGSTSSSTTDATSSTTDATTGTSTGTGTTDATGTSTGTTDATTGTTDATTGTSTGTTDATTGTTGTTGTT
ncbi:MAG: hypothetical protein H6711_07870 [Myxococcales bacterium]|nr:hypothetical protein [Myxococcales bacterium]